MMKENEIFCSRCRMSNCNNEENSQETNLTPNCSKKQSIHTKSSRKKACNVSPFHKLPTFYTTVLLIILGLLYMTSSVSCQNEFDGEAEFEEFLTPQNNTHGLLGMPRAEAVSKHERGKRQKCPKHFRHSYCMNGGKCHWIEDLKIPSCWCKRNWEGPRCQEPRIELTSDEGTGNANIIIIATVISCVVLVAVVTISCICWRRMKSVRKEIELEEVETDHKLIEETHSHHSTSIVLNE